MVDDTWISYLFTKRVDIPYVEWQKIGCLQSCLLTPSFTFGPGCNNYSTLEPFGNSDSLLYVWTLRRWLKVCTGAMGAMETNQTRPEYPSCLLFITVRISNVQFTITWDVPTEFPNTEIEVPNIKYRRRIDPLEGGERPLCVKRFNCSSFMTKTNKKKIWTNSPTHRRYSTYWLHGYCN